MQLRNHPKIKWNSESTWPPLWINHLGARTQRPVGEAGVLVDVKTSAANSPFWIWLVIEHDGSQFISEAFVFEDLTAYRKFLALIKRYLGKPISVLGSAEIDV